MSELSDLRDVPSFLERATRRLRLDAGTNLLVATDLEQNVLGTKRLPKRAAHARRSRLAYDVVAPALERMLPPRGHGTPPSGMGYIIRAREGRAVPAIDDLEWAYTLLWACGYICCYTGDVVVVTPHGWRVVTDHGRLLQVSRAGRPTWRSCPRPGCVRSTSRWKPADALPCRTISPAGVTCSPAAGSTSGRSLPRHLGAGEARQAST